MPSKPSTTSTSCPTRRTTPGRSNQQTPGSAKAAALAQALERKRQTALNDFKTVDWQKRVELGNKFREAVWKVIQQLRRQRIRDHHQQLQLDQHQLELDWVSNIEKPERPFLLTSLSEPYELNSKERLLEFMQRPEPVVDAKDLQFDLTPIDIQTLLELNLDCQNAEKDLELLPKDYKTEPSMTLAMYQTLYDDFVFGFGLYDNPNNEVRLDIIDELKSMFPDTTPFASRAEDLNKIPEAEAGTAETSSPTEGQPVETITEEPAPQDPALSSDKSQPQSRLNINNESNATSTQKLSGSGATLSKSRPQTTTTQQE